MNTRFRKKPVVIEAVQYRGQSDGDPVGVFRREEDRTPYVVTIHGQRCYISPGDWIIPEPDGVHFYPCKPDIFAATYEAADASLDGLTRIARERARQQTVEGYDQAHDDTHVHGELAICAADYATPKHLRRLHIRAFQGAFAHVPERWPFECCDWKPGNRIRELEKAGALIAAEIDRLLRAGAADAPDA